MMDQVEVLLNIEDRRIALDVEPNSFAALKREFDKLCEEDECLRNRRLQYAPTFRMFHGKLQKFVEVKKGYALKDGDEIEVGWSPLQLQLQDQHSQSVPMDRENIPPLSVLQSPGTSHNLAVLNCILQRHGLPAAESQQQSEHPSSPTPSEGDEDSIFGKENPAEKESEFARMEQPIPNQGTCTTPDKMDLSEVSESEDSMDDEQYGEIKNFFIDSEWRKLPKYAKKRERNKLELWNEQKRLGLVQGAFIPQDALELQKQDKSRKRKRTPPKKANVEDVQNHRRSLRIRKTTSEASSSILSEQEVDDPVDLASTKKGSGTPKNRRQCQKPTRLFLEKLTGTRLKVSFGPAARLALTKKCPPMNHILQDIRAHIQTLTGHDYIYRDELNDLCEQLIKDFPNLADGDDPKGYTRIKDSIDATIRTHRYQQREAEEALKNLNDSAGSTRPGINIVICENPEVTAVETLNTELKTTDPRSDTRVKFLISKTYELREIQFDSAQKLDDDSKRLLSCLELWKAYPHFQNGKMLIYEHTLLNKLNVSTLKTNFHDLINKLKRNLGWKVGTEVEQVNALVQIFRKCTPVKFLNQRVIPPVVIADEAEAEGTHHIATSHKGHAPCVLVTTTTDQLGNEKLSTAYLKLYSYALGTVTEPEAYEVVLLLLAGYFIGAIRYPDAYKGFLRFLEQYIHGGLTAATKAQRTLCVYNKFVKEVEGI